MRGSFDLQGCGWTPTGGVRFGAVGKMSNIWVKAYDTNFEQQFFVHHRVSLDL